MRHSKSSNMRFEQGHYLLMRVYPDLHELAAEFDYFVLDVWEFFTTARFLTRKR